MGDGLVPLLTGATRDADEYLWTLIGLRWARVTTGASVDEVLFKKGFAPFERALKQYWYKFQRRKSGGIKVVKELCEETKPNLDRHILVDQRITGLLGNYIVSLRGMGLVKKDTLSICEDAADSLLLDIRFEPPRSWASSWPNLGRSFRAVDLKPARLRLGRRLFGGRSMEMANAARAALAHPKATTWGNAARKELNNEQRRLADATNPVIALQNAALDAFGRLIHGDRALSKPVRRELRSLATAARDVDPFPSSWPAGTHLRDAIHEAMSSLARGNDPATTLLKLHVKVTREVRQTEPWLLHLGEIPAGYQDWQARTSGADFRFGNLRTLLRQTHWRPHAV